MKWFDTSLPVEQASTEGSMRSTARSQNGGSSSDEQFRSMAEQER